MATAGLPFSLVKVVVVSALLSVAKSLWAVVIELGQTLPQQGY
jgi:hypothetical protein